VADDLKHQFGHDVELIEGDRGEFTVWVNGEVVARKTGDDFPPDREVFSAVKQALA